MSISNLQDLFVHELRDILDAEKQLLKALPRMAKAAESEDRATSLTGGARQVKVSVEKGQSPL